MVAADGHQLVAQEAVDRAAHDVDGRGDHAADDDAAGAERARQRAAFLGLERGAVAQLRERLLDGITAQAGFFAQPDQFADAQRFVRGAFAPRRALRVDLGRPPQDEVDLPACELV